MRKRYKSSPLIVLLMVLLTCIMAPVAQAKLELTCKPGSATANSVWTFEAVYTDEDPEHTWWPRGFPHTEVEGMSLVNCGPRLGAFRLPVPEDAQDLVYNTLGTPYFFGFYSSNVFSPAAYESYTSAGQPCYATRQPTPQAAVIETGSGTDSRYGYGLSYVALERVAFDDSQTHVDYNGTSYFTNEGTEVQDNPATEPDESRGAISGMILTDHHPVWVVGVYADSDRELPLKYEVKKARDIYPGGPNVNLIMLTDEKQRKDVAGSGELFVDYYKPGLEYVVTKKAPLPLPYTVYSVPIMKADQKELIVNAAVFSQSAKRTGHAWVAQGETMVPGPNSALLGVYDSELCDFATNPVQRYNPKADNSGYVVDGSVVKLNLNVPAAGWTIGQLLYIKVATDGVNWVRQTENGPDLYTVNAGGKTGAYDAKLGIIKLAEPLTGPLVKEKTGGTNADMVVRGPKAFINYRPLSRNSFTVARPRPFAVIDIDSIYPGGTFKLDPERVLLHDNGVIEILADESGEPPLPANTFSARTLYRRGDATFASVIWLAVGSVGNEFYGMVPLFHHKGDPDSGALYKGYVSGGLNMSNPKQWPSPIFSENRMVDSSGTMNNMLIWCPLVEGYGFNPPMYYAPALRGSDPPVTHTIWAYAYTANPQKPIHDDDTSVTVYGSRPHTIMKTQEPEMVDYGGGRSLDWLSCYPQNGGASWPQGYDVDPLSILPVEEANSEFPDDGSSSMEFVFRVRYNNWRGLPPKPWLPSSASFGAGATSGVVLYLDATGTGDYKPYFMQPEVPGTAGAGAVYMYRFNPHAIMSTQGDPESYPMPDSYEVYQTPYYWYDHWQYQSLAIGTYHYFFACSDDSLTFDNETDYDSIDFVLSRQPSQSQWGAQRSTAANNSLEARQALTATALDPTLPRIVTGYPEISRNEKRTPNYEGVSWEPFDPTIYVDRPVRVPGLFEKDWEDVIGFSYPWKASQHPRVSCSLGMYTYNPDLMYGTSLDDLFIRYDDTKYGRPRFMGTLQPFYRSTNPLMPGAYADAHIASQAMTSGSTTKTDNVFRVLYQQIDNKPPIYMKLWINNASEKSGTTDNHKYTAYTMYPRLDQTKPYNYRMGVWYEYKTKLPAGPHTYYFEAYDGEHVVRFPVRSDHIEYDLPGEGGTRTDFWVPTLNTSDERYAEDYFDNDYFPGPYVNNPCVLTEAAVTPGTGKEGQQYKYKVKYSDPDGQRVYSAYVYIQINDRGDVRKLQMRPETPITNPTENNSQMWKDGVYYILDTASVNDLGLEKGVRRFYFEFTDDWGRQHDVNDIVRGETTRYPAGTDNWIDGPVISGNLAPTLSGGKVESQDGTANSATLWTYSVKYRDMNNDKPVLMKVYIGLLQADGKTIIWDDGHTMLQANDGDNLYSDGADFYYQTRMGAIDKEIGSDSTLNEKQYFYAFEAYDGLNWATYRSSASEELRSNSAGCVQLQELERQPDGSFRFIPMVAQRALRVDGLTVRPDNPSDILRVWGVYATEDLDQAATTELKTNYYTPDGFDFQGETILLTTSLPGNLDKVWIKYEAQSPLIGPLPVDEPAPAGVIPDAQVFVDYASNPNPVFIDDEKNGWVDDDPENSAWLRMRAVAAYENLPTLKYVTPEYPRSIASVEGVYLTPDLDKAVNPADQTNYFDPDKADGPIFQRARVEKIGDVYYAVLPDPDAVMRGHDKVIGVYTSEDMITDNLFAGTEKWQEAVVRSESTIWPSNPYDIAVIKGVYPSQDDKLANSLNEPLPPVWWHRVIWEAVPAPEIEQLILPNPLPAGTPKAHIKYIAAGGPEVFPSNMIGYVKLGANPGQQEVYVLVHRKHHSAGSPVVMLTEELPFEWMNATVAGLKATPTDASVIGRVLGVYTAKNINGTNIYAEANNPFRAGDEVVYLNQQTAGPVYIAYVPLKRTVYVKYSNIRFTHQVRGVGYEPHSVYQGPLLGYDLDWSTGKSHFYPDGEIAGNVRIKCDMDDTTGGLVGIWANSSRERTNLFDPRLVSKYVNYNDYQTFFSTAGNYTIRLSSNAPEGTGYMFANYYQLGDYNLHRWNRELRFLNPVADTSSVKASYFFGTKMPQKLQYNNPPSLTGGKVTPLVGSRSMQFTYTVVYRDQDGPNGQAPAYVRVYIDGVPRDMVPQNSGTPPYKEGAVYTYTPTGTFNGQRFHFEASDGAAVAWLDANGSFASVVGQIVQSIKPFDGPFINDPPVLTAGSVSPNTTAGISPWESVDYTVTYQDLDNEEPYIHNPVKDVDPSGKPLGVGLSESPRLWIDAGVNEDAALEILYTVANLEPDPLDIANHRIIVAQTETGGSPGWGINQYAGKLIQIANGSLDKTMYLVQSNTEDRLVIATNDLKADGVVSVASAGNSGLVVSKFRINGLVMRNVNSAQNFAQGVQYKLTVPKLAVGSHKYHFTAIGRENKPDWLKAKMAAENQVALPYSQKVRFPSQGYATGPLVISVPPAGNEVPVLTNPETSPMFIGPRVQIANINTNWTAFEPANVTEWANIRGVKGVYLNANLDADSPAARKNYYIPADDTEFTGTSIVPNNPLVPLVAADGGDVLVQFGVPSLSATGAPEVSPDVPGVIDVVKKVCVDATLAGENYFLSWNATTGKIALNKSLPRGTKSVYIQYEYKGGAQNPPAYVEYFAKSASVIRQGEPLTFRISYRDPDNDPPSYHDSVQGYLRLIFDNNSTGPALLPMQSPVSDYTVDVPFSLTLSNVPTGTHKYHFEGSDGYGTRKARYPAGTAGNEAALDYTLVVNARPVLSGGTVDPAGGKEITTFNFKVTYRDADGKSTDAPEVRVRLIKQSDFTEKVYPMTKVDNGKTYAEGVEYTTSFSGVKTGTYEVIFEASDGYQDANPFPATVGALQIRVRNENLPPNILSYSVTPEAAKTSQSFVFKAVYRDADGDAPMVTNFKNQDEEKVDRLKLVIDEGQTGSQEFPMTRASGPAPLYDRAQGVEYTVSVPGKSLGAGNHTYTIEGGDGTENVVFVDGLPDLKDGPVLNIPFFTDLRVVDINEKSNDNAPALTRVPVGQQVAVKGTMKFPYHTTTTAPTKVEKIVIQIIKPGGNVVSLSADVTDITREPGGKNWAGYLTVSKYPASGDPALVTGNSLTMSDSGEWVIRATWAGNATWDKAETDDNTDGQNDSARVIVGGPIRAIAVEDPTRPEDSTPSLDMITIPMIMGSSDIGRVLGFDKAFQMQIARWSPSTGTYFMYSAQAPFPALLPGEAIWIKPKTTYPAAVAIAVTDVETGMLSFANSDAKSLDPTYLKKYRLITPLVKAYPTQLVGTQMQYKPCEIPLRTGWNQFGNIFFNWKNTAQGKQDIGIPISEFKVRYLDQTLSLAEAKTAGWIRDYAWRYDADRRDYVLVHPTMAGAERTVRAWSGYWIKSFVDCQLIINPNTSYTGGISAASTGSRESTDISKVDAPPTIPD